MTKRKQWFVIALMLFALAAQLGVAQEARRFVSLTIELNGKRMKNPKEILLSYDGRTVRVPVRAGRIEVPSGALHAREVDISFSVRGKRVHSSAIPAEKLKVKHWTVLMADKKYEGNAAEFQRFVKNGVKARSSCVIVFSDPRYEDTYYFVLKCRE